jgi:phosphate transport system permease protein
VAIDTRILGAGGPGSPARPLVVSAARAGRRIRADRLASRLVVSGGIIVVASILAILLVIVAEVYPLFRKPTAELLRRPGAGAPSTPWTPAAGESLGVDEYREVAFAIERGGALRLLALAQDAPQASVAIPGLDGATVASVAAGGGGRYLIGTTDGRAVPLEVKFEVTFPDGRRVVVPRPAFGEPATLDPDRKRPITALGFAGSGTPITVAQVAPDQLLVQTTVEKKALVGPGRKEVSLRPLTVELQGEITALRLDGRGEDLILGTSRGQLIRYDMTDPAGPIRRDTVAAGSRPGASITTLAFLLGDRTLVAGDGAGGVSTWQVIPAPGGGERRLTRIHGFAGHGGPVVAIAASGRDKGFVTADAAGGMRLHYGTTGTTLLSLEGHAGALRSLAFAPKADGVLSIDNQGRLGHWRLDNPHPEITLRSLFGKVWYEGYSEPGHVWQSTGGTDDFEAKLSLTPLVYGTLKGTFYALLIAVPLALLAAVYVSEFMHPNLKAHVKPVVEIMAALPSVVLGFLAGLWLAPRVEGIVPGLFLVPLVVPLAILGALAGWRAIPVGVRSGLRPGSEVLVLLPVVVAGGWLALLLGGLVEATLLGGNYRGWLLSALGLTYDQRNCLVVGVAMGIAVIPIIFTIAEDSLANVPQHLRAGSLALGATRWQTALRIVLPTASPGIFSAIMIGFGRAVGETMIVLMATGNTPVMDWSIFNGFRALSANIAVELPEAPEGGTLFRVLFLAALLLFCLTFALNTAAELVRLRLRRRYRYL